MARIVVIELSIRGSFPRAEPVRVVWNGRPLTVLRAADAIKVRIPAEWVHTRSWTNELLIEGIAGATLSSVEAAIQPWTGPGS